MQIKTWKFPVIAIVTAVFLGALMKYELTKGIDLAGGSVLIYELQPDGKREVTEELTKSTAEIFQKRLDTLGTKEMSIRAAGQNQIMIQLPGVTGDSAERIKRLIAKSGRLMFKIVKDGTIEGQAGQPAYAEDIQRIVRDKQNGDYAEEYDTYDTAQYTTPSGAKQTVLLLNEYSVDGKHLTDARDGSGLALQSRIEFELGPEGGDLMSRTTKRYKGSQMAIVLDGQIISAPNIRSEISDRGEITGSYSKDEIKELVTVLRSGALPAKPILQSEDTIAPTLGDEAISRGLTAICLGVVITLVFMVVYYRLAGVIANIALILNLIILLGVMVLFEATLTLPGLAGIVLTMGMAVDANILINERIREEFDRGVPIVESVSAGYGHALSAILDSNITTLFTAAILYSVGTGPIKGFAVTLAVGIISSFFTALFVTRAFFEIALAKGIYTKPNYLKVFANTKIEFLKNRRPFVIAALVMVNMGFLLFIARGPEKFGIDFNGGAAVQMRLSEPLTKKEIVARITGVEEDRGGTKVKPFAKVDVSRLGAYLDGERAASWQVLHSSETGVDLSAENTADAAVAEDADEDAIAKAKEMTLEDALATEFAGSLAPTSFGKPVWTEGLVSVNEPDPTDPTKTVQAKKNRRWMSIRVRFDKEEAEKAEPKLTAESLQAEIDKVAQAASDDPDAALTHAQGATVTAAEDAPSVLAFDVKSKALDFNVNDEIVQTHVTSAIEKSAYGRALSNPFPFKTAIGASVAESLKARGIMAIILSLMAMIVYIAFRFEFKAGVAAALCLFHDVFAALGFMMIFDLVGIDAKINLTTIAAFLTIVGYSINDTIVTFDRMRENMQAKKIDSSSKQYEELLNDSINQVLSRTVLTSATVLLVLIVLAFAGVQSLQGFTLALIVGAVVGTFSSIYVATPILLEPNKRLGRLVMLEVGGMIVVGTVASFLL